MSGSRIDDELKPGRPLDRQIGRPRPLQNLFDISRDPAHGIVGVRTVSQQEAVLRPISPASDGRNAGARGKFDDLFTLHQEQTRRYHDKALGAAVGRGPECLIEIVWSAHRKRLQLHAAVSRHTLCLTVLRIRMIRVPHANP